MRILETWETMVENIKYVCIEREYRVNQIITISPTVEH